MWTVTTTGGREYYFPDFESACLAARERFGNEGYTITNSRGEVEAKSLYRGTEK